jgi:hypothetical protein
MVCLTRRYKTKWIRLCLRGMTPQPKHYFRFPYDHAIVGTEFQIISLIHQLKLVLSSSHHPYSWEASLDNFHCVDMPSLMIRKMEYWRRMKMGSTFVCISQTRT